MNQAPIRSPPTILYANYDNFGHDFTIRQPIFAYLRWRSSNETTDDVISRPFTIFTLADRDSGRDDSGYRMGSKLFQMIASSVITGQNELKKEAVLALASKLNGDSEFGKHFNSVLTLFDGSNGSVLILANEELNAILEKTANFLTTTIAKANQS
ncbi:hypothetical protein DFQ29_007585, partial [Apophysomyces sp. BC1021]